MSEPGKINVCLQDIHLCMHLRAVLDRSNRERFWSSINFFYDKDHSMSFCFLACSWIPFVHPKRLNCMSNLFQAVKVSRLKSVYITTFSIREWNAVDKKLKTNQISTRDPIKKSSESDSSISPRRAGFVQVWTGAPKNALITFHSWKA